MNKIPEQILSADEPCFSLLGERLINDSAYRFAIAFVV